MPGEHPQGTVSPSMLLGPPAPCCPGCPHVPWCAGASGVPYSSVSPSTPLGPLILGVPCSSLSLLGSAAHRVPLVSPGVPWCSLSPDVPQCCVFLGAPCCWVHPTAVGGHPLSPDAPRSLESPSVCCFSVCSATGCALSPGVPRCSPTAIVPGVPCCAPVLARRDCKSRCSSAWCPLVPVRQDCKSPCHIACCPPVQAGAPVPPAAP